MITPTKEAYLIHLPVEKRNLRSCMSFNYSMQFFGTCVSCTTCWFQMRLRNYVADILVLLAKLAASVTWNLPYSENSSPSFIGYSGAFSYPCCLCSQIPTCYNAEPKYFGVYLDWTLSYNTHCMKEWEWKWIQETPWLCSLTRGVQMLTRSLQLVWICLYRQLSTHVLHQSTHATQVDTALNARMS